MERVPIVELLDSDNGTAAEVAASLNDLQRINRWFGGVTTAGNLVRAVARQTGQQRLTMLEVAAGSGDVPIRAARALVPVGIQLKTTLLDRSPIHLKNARDSRRVAADALALPFPDNSFDLVSSTLFIHHLAPDDVVRCVAEGLRVSRHAVLINDLIRHPLHLAAVYAGFPLYRSRLTRHDAPASVRQAYTPAEMCAHLQRIQGARTEIHRSFLFRMAVTVWKL
jgi:hypothetical protein